MSDISPGSLARTADRKNEPMGLHIVSDPPGQHDIDIIFVHGLGGTSRMSWSHNHDLTKFWPKEWLPLEAGFKGARILTFGYDADIFSKPKDILNISDFASSLLMHLKIFAGSEGDSLGIGNVPIIFVVHSMGGLVVKKAYILGCQDEQYKYILETVRSIVFLATPHRGSDLAEILGRILSVTFQSKQYVADLQRNSARISDINEQFRHHADKLDLVSYYETLPTNTKVKKLLIVEKDSAVLGYPREISAPLHADHHGVNKFESRTDYRYVTVRSMVKKLVDKFKARKCSMDDTDSMRSLPLVDDLRDSLGIEPPPAEKREATMGDYVPGCCDWILSDSGFAQFMTGNSKHPTVLHITGAPGTGKTVMASFLVDHFLGLGLRTQYWYFLYSTFRSNRQCLLSLAFQIMDSVPAYMRNLLSRKADDIDSIAHSDPSSLLWKKLFVNALHALDADSEPLYWVIDAVDESENPNAFFKLLASLKDVRFPLRIILLTRSHTVTQYHQELSRSLGSRLSQITLATPRDRLQLFIESKMNFVDWANSDGELRNRISGDLLRKSQGSFLWLSLVMKDLATCFTEEDISEALDAVPEELSGVYQRLEETLTANVASKYKSHATLTAILSWVTCAERPLNDSELKEALLPDVLLSPRIMANRLCGDFVVVSKNGDISMAHHTAREYILNSATTYLRVDSASAHTLILDKCLSVITSQELRGQLRRQDCTGLPRYCCLSWAHHLVHSEVIYGPKRDDYVRAIKTMFSSEAVRVWIEAVAMTKQLSVFTSTSRALLAFAKLLLDRTANENPASRPLDDIDFISSWATELIRVVGKFGSDLVQCPKAIYTHIPLFCPPNSVLSRQFSPPMQSASPRITGISNVDWDDSLAKLTFGHDQKPTKVYGLDSSFGVLARDNSMHLYDAATFQQLHRFRHNEFIHAADFSPQGALLVTAGTRTVKVWRTSDGLLLDTFPNPYSLARINRQMRARSVTFSKDSSRIILFCVDSTIRHRRLNAYSDSSRSTESYEDNDSFGDDEDWTAVELREHDPAAASPASHGSPNCVAFSPDGSQVAVSYRVWLTSVWDTWTGGLIGKCEPHGHMEYSANKNYRHPVTLGWHPTKDLVIGIYQNGTVFKWDLASQVADDMDTYADLLATDLTISPDGRLLVTSQRDGSLKVFSFESFTLLFHLTSMTQPAAVAFSPDGRRIYDVRGQFCNVWQPNALIRVADQDEHGSDSASSHYDHSLTGSAVPEVSTVSLRPVSAIAAPGNTGSIAYAFANDEGLLKIYSDAYMARVMDTAGAHGVVPSPPPPPDIDYGLPEVVSLNFSSDGEALAVATIGDKVFVYRLQSDRSGFSACNNTIDPKGSVLQVVLDNNGKLLLVHTRTATCVWDLLSDEAVFREDHDEDESCQWLASPVAERSFIAVRPSTISMLTINGIDNFEGGQTATSSLNVSYTMLNSVFSKVAPKLSRKLHQNFHSTGQGVGEGHDKAVVHRVFTAPGCSCLLVQMSAEGYSKGQREVRFHLLDISLSATKGGKGKHAEEGDNLLVGATATEEQMTLHAQALPQPVLDKMEIPLGFMVGATDRSRRESAAKFVPHKAFSRGSNAGSKSSGMGGSSNVVLAFIDCDFWVRTWSLNDATGQAMKRHFFVPRDWINMDCLDLAMVTLDGRFLCPRNGEVAVVHHGLSGSLSPL